MVFVVMFVALIFLLAASQIRTHATVFDLVDHATSAKHEAVWPARNVPLTSRSSGQPGTMINTLKVTPDNQILWNGDAVSQAELYTLFNRSKEITPEPEIHFRPDPLAKYETVALILGMANQSGMMKMVVPDLKDHCAFGKAWAARPAGTPYAVALSITLPERHRPSLEHSELCPPSP